MRNTEGEGPSPAAFDAVLDRLMRDFEKHGPVVIEALRKKDPAAYLAAIVAMVLRCENGTGSDARQAADFILRVRNSVTP
jgi:hypothetical protein